MSNTDALTRAVQHARIADECDENFAYDLADRARRAADTWALIAQAENGLLANKVAAYRAELIVNPYGVGTREHDKWWVDFGTPITEAVTS